MAAACTNPGALVKGEIGVAGVAGGDSASLWFQLSLTKGCLKKPSAKGARECRGGSFGTRGFGLGGNSSRTGEGKVARLGLALEGGDTTVLAYSGLGAGFRTDLKKTSGDFRSALGASSLRQQRSLVVRVPQQGFGSNGCCGSQVD
jgi:hypothetical protein